MPTGVPRDEMVDGAGTFRPHWRGLLGALASLGQETLAQRALLMDRFMADEGVTSLLPGAGSEGPGPEAWRCDPVPLILPAAEFEALEAALIQRAGLLEAVLRDVYGGQSLLAEGALPPALIHANPAFLRPCRRAGGEAPEQLLHLYAADLMRAADGRWRILADRTASPAGLAHAVENRRALSRHMPEFIRSREIRRLGGFFEAWQEALQQLAPPGAAGTPRVALLTTGHAGPRWFEEVILARELSCALAEGGDLTVRDGVLYLKTLRGLQRVDVLLRRQDGRTIDPLELAPTLTEGVTGLLDAARGGAVRIINDPGTGFAEAPALAAFLPGLARRLLGQDLLLPGARTLWLGDPAARAEVGGDFGPWLVRRALDGTIPSVRAGALAPEARAELARRILAAPEEWAVSEALTASVAPCVGPEGLEPRPIMLRLFLLFDGTTWRALPGGLARTLAAADPASGKRPKAILTKDVWVPVEEAGAILGPRQASLPVLPIRRASGDVPSRVADNFFWLGRYLERLEGAARLIRTGAALLSRANPTPRELAELRSLSACLMRADLLDAETAQGLGAGPLITALLRATRESGPLLGVLGQVSRLAGLLRDRLTGEMHAALSQGLRQLQDQLRPPAPTRDGARDAARGLDQLSELSAAVLGFCATVAGLAAENMVRGGGRLFLDLGRRVERAQAIVAELARALDQPGTAAQPARLEPGLRLALLLRDSVITYRSRYLTVLQPAPVLDLVLADEGNPRALAFQLAAVRDMLADLADEADQPLVAAADGLLEEARAMVREVAEAAAQAEVVARLPPRLRAMEGAIAELSDRVARRYFALLPVSHSLGSPLGASDPTARLRGAA